MNLLKTVIFVLILSATLAAGCKSSGKTGDLFIEITEDAGLNFVHDPAVDSSYFYPEIMGAGGGFLDYDNDGDLDIYLVNGQRHGSNQGVPLKHRLFRQGRSGKFSDVTDEAFKGVSFGYGQGVAAGDIDNDGDVDLYLANFDADQLLKNNGDGTFSDVTRQAGINNPAWASSVSFLDYDRDSFLDIYVATYVKFDPAVICTDKAGRKDYCGPQGYRGVPDQLYRNNGDGTFKDVSNETGIAGVVPLKGLGVVSADFNQDRYPDIYVANDQEPNHFWVNSRNGKFQDRAMALGAAVNALGQPEASMGVTAGDADGDGDLELFLTHLRNETNTFYRNMGDLGFQDETATSGLGPPSLPFTGFGTGFFDYDHDGDLDIAVVNGRVTRGPRLTQNSPEQYMDPYKETSLLFENQGPGVFRRVTDRGGAFTDQVENRRGLAFGDVDNDGDLDLLVTSDGDPARLFENVAKPKGRWLMVRAMAWNRDAIGATVIVTAGDRKYMRDLQPGYSYQSTNDVRAHFGLGEATKVDEITVIWPDGSSEKFSGVKAESFITLEKGKGTAGP